MQSWLKDAANTFNGVNGSFSAGYAALTASLLAAGLGYIVAPGLTLQGVSGQLDLEVVGCDATYHTACALHIGGASEGFLPTYRCSHNTHQSAYNGPGLSAAVESKMQACCFPQATVLQELAALCSTRACRW